MIDAKTDQRIGYTLNDALELARTFKYFPVPKKEDPLPTPEEALKIIEPRWRESTFNWLTGAAAVLVLRRATGRTFKVVSVDNYDRDLYDDKLIEDGLTEDEAKQRAALENQKAGEHSDRFYRTYPEEYRLRTFDPNT